MFKSFFPKPGAFFLSAFVWALIAVIFWQAGGGDWVARITGASGQIPISAARFWSLDFLIFYAYYIVCVGLFAFFWFIYSPHRWQYWSILGTALIIFVTWFLVEVGVAVNAWYAPFYDLIQTALSSPHKVTIEQFYREVGVFLGIALIAVVISVLNNFFVSHYVFRWRTAMNEYYMANWQQLRHIEGAAQRVQEDTMRFASTLENMGVSFINAIMTLIAFLPVLVTLSAHVPELPIVGHIPVPFSKMVSDNLTHENLVKQYENALSELAGLVIPDDRSSAKPSLLQVIQHAEELAESVKKSREELFGCNLEFQKAESAYAAELLRHEESISNRQARLDELAKSEALIEEMEFHNELIKDLSAARSEIRRRLWKIVSAAISHYFTRIRGEATIVEQGEDGFTENGRPVKGLSGSAKDTLGLAVRAALSRVFIPGAPLMIVDEPFAACDSVREVAGIGVLAGLGFDQTILVTHSDLADSVADKIVHL